MESFDWSYPHANVRLKRASSLWPHEQHQIQMIEILKRARFWLGQNSFSFYWFCVQLWWWDCIGSVPQLLVLSYVDLVKLWSLSQDPASVRGSLLLKGLLLALVIGYLPAGLPGPRIWATLKRTDSWKQVRGQSGIIWVMARSAFRLRALSGALWLPLQGSGHGWIVDADVSVNSEKS